MRHKLPAEFANGDFAGANFCRRRERAGAVATPSRPHGGYASVTSVLSICTNAPVVLLVGPPQQPDKDGAVRRQRRDASGTHGGEMKQQQATKARAGAGEPDDIRETLTVIQEQGRQTLELVRTLVSLLQPKEGGRQGPSLEELVAAMVALQRDLIIVTRTTQADLNRLGETLPTAVAEAVQNQTSLAPAVRS